MDLKHLRSFIAVAEELNFRRAAERLNLTQPPLSLQINKLEEELGIRLLERGRNKKIFLTTAGQLFLSDARIAVQAAEKAFLGVRQYVEGQQGRIRIGFTDDFLFGPLPTVIAQFLREYPHVTVNHEMRVSHEIIAKLDVGDLDIALVCLPIQRLDPHFIVTELPPIRIVAVLNEEHPLANRDDIWLRELKDEPTQLMPTEIFSGFSAHLSRLYAHAQVTPTPLAFGQNSMMMTQIIAKHGGILLASETSIPPEWPGVHILTLKDNQPFVDTGLIYNAENASGTIIENFRHIVEHVFHHTSENK